MRAFARWPLALLAFALIGVAVAVDVTNSAAVVLGGACEVLGIAAGGAFIYAEGARHREWLDAVRHDTPDDTPGTGQEPGGMP